MKCRYYLVSQEIYIHIMQNVHWTTIEQYAKSIKYWYTDFPLLLLVPFVSNINIFDKLDHFQNTDFHSSLIVPVASKINICNQTNDHMVPGCVGIKRKYILV